jgi:hypothetical protein
MELSADSQPYPQFTQNTLERIQSLQLGPRAWGGGRSDRIPAAPAAGSNGNEVGEGVGSPVTGLWPKFKRRSDRRRCSAVSGGRRPLLCCFGAVVVRPRQDAARVALGDREEESRGLGWHWVRVDLGFRRWRLPGRRRSGMGGGGRGRTHEEGAGRFK